MRISANYVRQFRYAITINASCFFTFHMFIVLTGIITVELRILRRGFPSWQGDVFIAALAETALWHVQLDGDTEVLREAFFTELGERIRDVEQGPDGWIYLLTDSGKLVQVSD